MADLHQLHHCQDQQFPFMKYVNSFLQFIWNYSTNYDKTVLMPINPVNETMLQEFRDLGFSISYSFKLLGLTISCNLDNIRIIYDELVNKISSLANFWARFRLTLPGRITVMKTCLVSQLNYIGCFLPMPEDTRNLLQDIINGFVKKIFRCQLSVSTWIQNMADLVFLTLKIFFRPNTAPG